MTEKFFVDTNVFVYAYESARTAKNALAIERIGQLWRERSGRTSIQVLKEFYATSTRKLAHRMSSEQAWEITSSLLAWDPQPTDRHLLVKAHEIEQRYRISWWDSLIVAAAQLQDCDVLLTEDLQAGMRFDQVTVLNPFAAGVQEQMPVYRVDRLPSRHRSRGRPRKTAARDVG
jgi:predicted nucleic acid-binding protein